MRSASLADVWQQQAQYNRDVRQIQDRSEAEWMETYILGMMSELGDLLKEMNWKRHRLRSSEDFGPNVPEELVDITKYVYSMWILMGYTPEEMLQRTYLKGTYLASLFRQNFFQEVKDKVVIFDLDDVLANLRKTLAGYFSDKFELPAISTDSFINGVEIHLDLEGGWKADEYRRVKNTFEKEGGYRTVEPLLPIKPMFDSLWGRGYSIAVYTARPVTAFKRIRWDTFLWFEDQGAQPDLLEFGSEDRIRTGCKLQSEGRFVVLVEDNPELARRAHNSGLQVIVPRTGYNQGISNFKGSWEKLIDEVEGRHKKWTTVGRPARSSR